MITWGRTSLATDKTKDLPTVAVSTTPIPLDTSIPPADLRCATIRNDGPNTVYIGGESVTSGRGFPVAANGSLILWAHPANTWAICATSESAIVRVVGA